MRNSLCTALSLAALCAGCTSLRTSFHYDSLVDFAKLETYAWEGVRMSEPENPMVRESFKRAVDAGLQARGYQEVSENPDFRISMYLGKLSRSQIIDSGYRAEGWVGAVHTHTYEEGNLILDVRDASGGMVIWHGKATEVMNTDASREAMATAHNFAVEALLEHFPPPIAPEGMPPG